MLLFRAYLLIGGAGFIGSRIVDYLLNQPNVTRVTIYDDFSYGREWHYAHHLHIHVCLS